MFCMPESAFWCAARRGQVSEMWGLRDWGLRDFGTKGLRDSGLRDQEQRHRRIWFQEEFLKLLRNHGVEFDERYIGQ
jgi:hypothetical protein